MEVVSCALGSEWSASTVRPQSDLAWKEVTVAVPALVRMRMPAKPEAKVVSVAVSIHVLGSEPEATQMFAVRFAPTARKWMVYDVPAVAVNGRLASIVVTPPTRFWMKRLAPSV